MHSDHESCTTEISIIRWIVGIVDGIGSFLFSFNMFFKYSSDNYQNDCAGGIDCLSCVIYVPTRQSFLTIGFSLEYMLMIQILKDTLTLSNVSYSGKLFRFIVPALVTPSIAVPIVGFASIKTQVSTTIYHQDIHACTAQNVNSNRRLMAFAGLVCI